MQIYLIINLHYNKLNLEVGGKYFPKIASNLGLEEEEKMNLGPFISLGAEKNMILAKNQKR